MCTVGSLLQRDHKQKANLLKSELGIDHDRASPESRTAASMRDDQLPVLTSSPACSAGRKRWKSRRSAGAARCGGALPACSTAMARRSTRWASLQPPGPLLPSEDHLHIEVLICEGDHPFHVPRLCRSRKWRAGSARAAKGCATAATAGRCGARGDPASAPVYNRHPGKQDQVAQKARRRARCDIAGPLPLLRRARWRARALLLEREGGCFVPCRSAAWRPQASWRPCLRRPASPLFQTCCRGTPRPSGLRALL